jgi:hypothetical protein
MPASPVFGFAVPAPHAASFTDGEQALSVASPFNSAPANTAFRLARWFDFDGGVYEFKHIADDTAVWLLSITANNGRILFGGSAANAGVGTNSVYIPRGRFRLDVLLTNMGSTPSNCYIALSIRQAGRLVYTSSPSGWVFDTTVIPDSQVPLLTDVRLTYPLFSLTPNWSGGVTERVTFGTEILPSETDSEQRRSFRRFARRSFEASFLRQGANRSRMDNFFMGVGKSEMLVPLWHEQQRLSATLGSTYEFPEGSLIYREFRAGQMAVVMRGPSDFELLTIQAHNLDTDTITFTAAPSGSWGLDSILMPVRAARLVDAVRFENLTDNVATVQARFELLDPLTWPDPSWGYCSPLFRFRANRATALSIDFDRLVYPIDNETGMMEVVDPAQKTRLGTRFAVVLRGRDALYRFRQFIAKARGRAVRFWMPDWMQDIIPAGDIQGAYIDAIPAGFSDYVRSYQDARQMIGVEFLDGRPTLFREVTQVSRVGQVERFVVNPALPPILKSDVARVMFVLPTRFDQDGFELQHMADQGSVVQTTLVTRSAERAGLPPIECFTTSMPYPVAEVDALDMAPSLVSLSLTVFSVEPEAVSTSMTFVSGEIRELLKQYGYVEGLTIGATLQAGALRTVLLAYNNWPPEAMEVSVSLQAGTLRTLLIQYNNYPPEALNINAELIGGTLL